MKKIVYINFSVSTSRFLITPLNINILKSHTPLLVIKAVEDTINEHQDFLFSHSNELTQSQIEQLEYDINYRIEHILKGYVTSDKSSEKNIRQLSLPGIF